MYDELGGDKLLTSFVEVGEVDGKQYALPYYFGSRYNFYRKDIWAAAGKTVPTTLAEFDETVKALQHRRAVGLLHRRHRLAQRHLVDLRQRRRDLAEKDGDKWVGTLSSDETVKGLTQFQALYQGASLAPVTEFDSTPWVNINNNDATGVPEAATIIAPGWAHWSIGDLAPDPKDATKTVATWNDDTFGTFVLPGVDGGAPRSSRVARTSPSRRPARTRPAPRSS